MITVKFKDSVGRWTDLFTKRDSKDFMGWVKDWREMSNKLDKYIDKYERKEKYPCTDHTYKDEIERQYIAWNNGTITTNVLDSKVKEIHDLADANFKKDLVNNWNKYSDRNEIWKKVPEFYLVEEA